MTEPDNRLKACAELITGDYVCDIGTDHGYLPAYLLTSGRCTRAIAADINEMPLDAARRTLM
ncbi:MAG: tRNA (adenine(22)-N(1))-methyltransferase TrmK, partial [Oscillospiraceae bacterium]|nr:tRNA (adenine(22)-N(1))-methyltransferase TrmK [Oscillospiraceae bacterium]